MIDRFDFKWVQPTDLTLRKLLMEKIIEQFVDEPDRVWIHSIDHLGSEDIIEYEFDDDYWQGEIGFFSRFDADGVDLSDLRARLAKFFRKRQIPFIVTDFGPPPSYEELTWQLSDEVELLKKSTPKLTIEQITEKED